MCRYDVRKRTIPWFEWDSAGPGLIGTMCDPRSRARADLWRLGAAMAFAGGHGRPRRCPSCAAIAWPGLDMWMLKRRAGAVSGELRRRGRCIACLEVWHAIPSHRGACVSSRPNRTGVLRLQFSIALLRPFCKPQCPILQLQHRQGATRVPMIARVTCDVGAMRFGLAWRH